MTLVFLRLRLLQRWRIAVRWSAPEVLLGRPHSPASNVWSYGVLAWEVFSFGQIPYELWNDDQVATAVTSGAVLSRPSVCVIIFSVESRRRDFSGEGRRGRMWGWQHLPVFGPEQKKIDILTVYREADIFLQCWRSFTRVQFEYAPGFVRYDDTLYCSTSVKHFSITMPYRSIKIIWVEVA